jgi:hypothetical protein
MSLLARALELYPDLRRTCRTCAAKLEPDAPRPDTHTCQLHPGHSGPHRCPVCQEVWV